MRSDSRQEEIVVSTLAVDQCEAWDEYVQQHPEGSLYHLSGWKRAIKTAYGHGAHYLMARIPDQQCGAIAGVLPLIHLKNFLFGNHLISIPYCDQGGILARDGRVAGALLREAVRLGRQLGTDGVELRQAVPLPELPSGEQEKLPAIMRVGNKVSMELELPRSARELWDSFKAKLRSQIKKPLRSGLSYTHGGEELLDGFYKVFVTNMRDLGSPVHSKQLLRTVLRTFGEQARLIMVFLKARPVAGGLVIGYRSALWNPWASSLREYGRYSPNMLLYWAMLEYACEQKYREFHFGRSTPGSGPHKFKQQWGAQEKPLVWLQLTLNGRRMSSPVVSPRLQLATNCWQKIPVPVSRMLGPLVRKHISL